MLPTAKRIVIKIGSSLLVASGALRREWLASLAADIAALREQGKEIILVSSGAVALGRPLLGLGTEALSLEEKQAAAAAGQPLLMQAWQAALDAHNIHTAQLLLTLDDSEERRRYLNARATFGTLLARGLVPIVNENDTVATAELKFGDNDRLAARVAQMISADTLVLFSDIDGLYTADPRSNPEAKLVPEVREVTAEIEAMGGTPSKHGSGGMITKIWAAKRAARSGAHTVIASGRTPDALPRLLQGAPLGTLLIASQPPLAARKQWLADHLQLAGRIQLDAGASNALRTGSSLLPVGVTHVEGDFERGAVVACLDETGEEIARGLINYASSEARRIAGCPSAEIEQRLGYLDAPELIHRDNLVLV